MKKKAIPTAQMGRSNIQRRAYKSAGYTAPKADTKKAESKPAETKPTPPVQAKPPVLLRPLLTPPPNWKQDKMYNDYMKTVQGESFKISTPKEEKKEPVKKSSAPKKVVKREKVEGLKVPERKKPELKVAAPLDKTLRRGPEKRKFSNSQIKIMEVMKKGEKADGTMKESAQRKIASIRAKDRMAAKKVENKAARADNKAGRVAKRAAVKTAKANVKAVKKSFKK